MGPPTLTTRKCRKRWRIEPLCLLAPYPGLEERLDLRARIMKHIMARTPSAFGDR